MTTISGLIGLPLHPLLVHAVVVLLPLEVLTVLLVELRPRLRRCLTGPAVLGALVLAGLVPVTIIAGEALAARVGPLPAVAVHESYATLLLPWSLALSAAVLVQWGWRRWVRPALLGPRAETSPPARVRAVDILLSVILVVVALTSLVLVVLTGDSGARAVWSGVATAM